ncbi:MAG: PAS domain-containing sensor histidine kinase [Nitrospirae bacterium]|nr:PAS domain-containing sensor histidine kinase [Nitrospirota bacterium]
MGNTILRTDLIEALLHSTPDFIYFKDLNGKYVAVSDNVAIHSGSVVTDMIGKSDLDFFPGEQAEAMFLEDKKIIETGEAVKDKIEKRVCPNGSEIWISVTKFPWKDSAGEIVGLICMCREVTERIDRERHILDMLSIATHDIRGPLSSIGSMIKLLMRGAFGFIDESVKVTLSDISGRIIRLEKLLGEYLCKSSMMNVKMPEKEYLDLRQDIIDPILEEFAAEIEESMIRIDSRLGAIPGNKVIIKANARWIKIVYRNLIRNAIKYAASGQIAFGFEDKGDHYRLNVYNSGPPVPEERRTNIFEKFESSDSSGLGLAICRNLIKKHGGDMWYENTWDNHPNFIFTVPK